MLLRSAKRFLIIGQREASVLKGGVLCKQLYTDVVVYSESCISQKFVLFFICNGQFCGGSLILK